MIAETITYVETNLTTGESQTMRLRPRPSLTVADVEAELAKRKADGLLIDPANCEKFRIYVEMLDPYCLFEKIPEEWSCISKEWFVRNLPDGCWVHVNDLPEETYKALMPKTVEYDPTVDVPF